SATLYAGVTIGEHSVVDVGAVVTRSVQPHAIVRGNPATVVAFANTLETPARPAAPSSALVQTMESKVRGVNIYELPFIRDPRGNLTVGEFDRTLPFVPKRYFMTFDRSEERRVGKECRSRVRREQAGREHAQRC